MLGDFGSSSGSRKNLRDVDEEAAGQAAAYCPPGCVQGVHLEADRPREAEVAQLLKHTLEHFSGLDIFVNNAARLCLAMPQKALRKTGREFWAQT
ncbi:hypothetical protein WJX75_006972 [Coccomyxa subellipsoidea]|uniref:NAD(P)-binding protein n=1 Tax=Coccomyxa subellipsoidea TaxID=248742 RepID=A0ABR2YBQ2_9CHLO